MTKDEWDVMKHAKIRFSTTLVEPLQTTVAD